MVPGGHRWKFQASSPATSSLGSLDDILFSYGSLQCRSTQSTGIAGEWSLIRILVCVSPLSSLSSLIPLYSPLVSLVAILWHVIVKYGIRFLVWNRNSLRFNSFWGQSASSTISPYDFLMPVGKNISIMALPGFDCWLTSTVWHRRHLG